MSIHFYRDLNGYVGQPREDDLEPTARQEADRACSCAMSEADDLAALLDRYDGDAGEDAALIDGWAQRIRDLATEIRAALGEPRSAAR